MKKQLFLTLLIIGVLMSPIFAQSLDSGKIETEYNGLKWGSSKEKLKEVFPNAYRDSTNDQGDEVYFLDLSGATRVFFLGNNKFYRGRVAYSDCTDEKVMALMKKLVDTYGKFDDQSKGSDRGNEYITLINHYSDNITIRFELISVKNTYGYTISQMVMIDFENKALQNQIARERINKMQDDLEL